MFRREILKTCGGGGSEPRIEGAQKLPAQVPENTGYNPVILPKSYTQEEFHGVPTHCKL